MNKQEIIDNLSKQYQISGVIDLDHMEYNLSFGPWINKQLVKVRKEYYGNNERIVIFLDNDYYQKQLPVGLKLKTLQENLNLVDISNFFCLVVSSNTNLLIEAKELTNYSTDSVPIQLLQIDSSSFNAITMESTQKGQDGKNYRYSSTDLVKMDMNDLTKSQKYLLTESKNFCMYPWVHIHAYPTGEAFPCCGADHRAEPLGDCRQNTLKEIWNSDNMKNLRKDMLSDTWNPYCVRCYEQEEAGFFSMRKSANKHLGHYISKVEQTNVDGSLDNFEMTYWDIRFSNLCNLSCRSCGYMFSSKWHSDQVKLLGEWGKKFAQETPVLNYAGRTETDMWEQLVPHLDYVGQIYFAGGEPLMMEEHYNILEELERRGRFDVRLIYNTNFTHVKLKDRYVFDYWKKFKSVSVGASLDAMGLRGEYIRKGTNWAIVEENRQRMLDTCPEVDFYISPTLSIMNAWHLPDFHRAWVDKGLIRPQDLNVNILQDPPHYRIDIATEEYKEKIKAKYQAHLDWLRPDDPLQRATQGFESAINFMTATDNAQLIDMFWKKTHELDSIRHENVLEVIPELKALK